MRSAIKRFGADIRHLIFPDTCLCCSAELSHDEHQLCLTCLDALPTTNMHQFEKDNNPLQKLFWGRIPLNFAYSHLYFQKKGGSQRILFSIKYAHNRLLAVFFGEQIGKTISTTLKQSNAQVIVPVPLHHRKKFIRGYNQSEELGKGISNSTGIPLRTDLLLRNRFTETQTKKSRFERWGNLNDAFRVSKEVLTYDHIVLVDDVATTGATIEQLALEIKKVHPKVELSVVTLALA